MAIQPSLRRVWQSVFKSMVAAYRRAYAAKQQWEADHADSGVDTADIKEYEAIRDKEVYLRGMVRGAARMLIILSRPTEYKDKAEIRKLELDYGMPGERHAPSVGSRHAQEFFEDNWSDISPSDWGDAMHRDGLKLQKTSSPTGRIDA